MTHEESGTLFRRAACAAVFILVTAIHFLVTFVVILLVLSTLAIMSRPYLDPGQTVYPGMIAGAAIFLVSLRLYLRSTGRIFHRIKTLFFPDLLP
ncbi:MAG: hypothetical protein JSU90_09705 [Nitrospiraceae bacterium]|nr:MAG: hypothetical protein JSU90_09705 [Nitrospiraceae bacterium]